VEINNQITAKLNDYIMPIAEFVGFELYIVNNRLLRVCGTGMYEKMLGIRLPDNTSNGWVINHVQPLVMLTPMEHTVCDECPMKKSNNCGMEYSIHEPIIVNGACFGVLTMSSTYDERSKYRMVQEKDKLVKYMNVLSKQVANIIEMNMMELRYKNILKHSSESLIITDEEGEIIEKSHTIGSRTGSVVNIYNIIPRDHLSYGKETSDVTFDVGDDLRVKKVIVHINKFRYQQLFFISRINAGVKNENHSNNLLDEELFLSKIVGTSDSIKKLKEVVKHVAKFDSNCLILGESGTGKEMVAELVHKLSDRRNGPFIPINCAAIPDNLVESELFGYESGAFTGANKKGKIGLFEAANNGTIFLDEIGDMPIYLQPKLLRVLESRRFKRIGGTEEIQLNVRIIAATHQQIKEQIKTGEFREDLYYRLNVIPLKIESLRDRSDDVLELTKYFIKKYNDRFRKNISGITSEVKKQLLIYDWPGNVRELENVIEYAVTMENGGALTITSLPETVGKPLGKLIAQAEELSLEDFKRQNIKRLIAKYGRSVDAKAEIAKEMGMSLSTLYRYLRKYDIS
jgi:transcriptional regulator with PAS, ATPase and Fis domain